MYIGKLGDGSSKDDGIYVLVKEVMDNSIDEHMMGHGKVIEVKITDQKVTVRDYGRVFRWARSSTSCPRSTPAPSTTAVPSKSRWV